MPDFKTTGKQLHQARSQQEINRLNLHRAKEQLEKTEAAQRRLDRYFDAQNSKHQTLQQQIDGQKALLGGQINQLENQLQKDGKVLGGLLKQFNPFTDPRKNIGFKHTDYPFLMFPLRLETRFKKVDVVGAAPIDQMWVRVYPDECLVDTFEDVPSESEVLNARKFWVDWVAAGGLEAGRRGAWKAMVSGSGAGRSAWLINAYRPDPTISYPQKANAEDVMLVLATEVHIPAAEKSAVASFWTDWWKADGADVAEQNAYSTLVAALGASRAEVITSRYIPANLSENPPAAYTRADVLVSLAFLELPESSSFESQRQPWSQAPRVHVLPERFVLIGYRGETKVLEQIGKAIPLPLIAGPDPLADAADQMQMVNGEIIVPDPMKWMVDFDEAEKLGMGFRVNLDAMDLRAGYDQLMVVGIRLGADEEDGAEMLQTLFHHHEAGNSGFSILPQGSATNNTEGAGSGFSETEDSDDSYDLVLGGTAPLTREGDWLPRKDGQWLAEMLGIDISTFNLTLNSRGRDQCEARAINTALWPATWGYLMDSMMSPVFDDETIERTRWFFNHFVVARGTVPAIRIGDQPYGILPTTVFSRLDWLEGKGFNEPFIPGQPEGNFFFVNGLHKLLQPIRADWAQMSQKAAWVGKPGQDPHQVLLDVLGLHPDTAEYYQRYAESLEQFTNRMKLQGFWGELKAALMALEYTLTGRSLLNKLGYTEGVNPEILEKFFLKSAHKLKGDIIDNQKLSEVNPIRDYTDDERNYIEWLKDAAETSFETLRKEEGFTDNKKPRALLYLMLRFALEQSYWDSSLRLLREFKVINGSQYQNARLDPSFVHVGDAPVLSTSGGSKVTAAKTDFKSNKLQTSGKPIEIAQRSESRYEWLYQTAPGLTNSPDMLVADYIPSVIGKMSATQYLKDQLTALGHLAETPTARLDRLLAEHVDLCTYRLDSWRWGILNYQLAGMRYNTEDANGNPGYEGGIFLGAFGYLEKVKSENKSLSPVTLDSDLDPIFNPATATDLPPLMRNDKNGGFIHAPSINHAITAAILRNGYLANATPSNPDTLKVNLSSERVRVAMGVIEGVRSGQKLGALLGYQLERGLHDRHQEAEVDKFIFELRKEFPLVADKLNKTRSEEGDSITTLEARNVVDGFAFVNHIKKTGNKTYPFGKSLPTATAAEAAVINSEVDRMLDTQDAVADLVMAEGVFQTVQGNFSRVASTLEAYAKGTFPPEPEVAQTPRSGFNLTHRMGIHFEPGLNPALSPNTLPVTPRSYTEPAVNKWLDGLMPDSALVFCKVSYFDPSDNSSKSAEVTQQDLELQPLDLLYLVSPEANQAMADLDDLIVSYVIATYNPRWDVDIEITYTERESGKYNFFELGALLRPLRSLLLKSRPLNAGDVALPNEATEAAADTQVIDPSRFNQPLSDLGSIVLQGGPPDDLDTLLADMAAWLPDTATNRNAILGAIDGWITRVMTLYGKASQFGIQGAGTGFAYDWKRLQFGRLMLAVDELADRWQESLDAFDDLIANDYPGAATDEERYSFLRQAEGFVSTELSIPLPATPAAYLTAVNVKRGLFAAKLGNFSGMLTASTTALSTLISNINNELPLDAFEGEGMDISEIEDEVIRFAEELEGRIKLLRTEINQRKSKAESLITTAAGLGGAGEKVQTLTKAAKAIFGEDFKIVPEFTLSEEQASEWDKAWTDRDHIQRYLSDPKPAGLEIDFPVDEWLYGVARVREDAGLWERVMMLTKALGNSEPQLSPIQLPYKTDDNWLALPHPDDYEYDGERLLYTAHYAVPFAKGANQCGLLVDEWTEVIPTKEETTGITFHYDRPNSEPPQTMLLVTSPQMNGSWKWDDLVDAIRETFEEARLRAVEPGQVDETSYSRFLPATLASVSVNPLTIMLNYAVNNNVYQLLNQDSNG